MKTPTERLQAYVVDVQDPAVSGMEHLEMLFNRSELAKVEALLTPAERQTLAVADQCLLQQADAFYTAIEAIADLKSWRERKAEPPTHWWWYLDVLRAAPVAPTPTPSLVPA